MQNDLISNFLQQLKNLSFQFPQNQIWEKQTKFTVTQTTNKSLDKSFWKHCYLKSGR